MANLLGALALAVSDDMNNAVCLAASSGDTASAALVHLSHAPLGGVEPLRQVLGLSHSATVRLVDRLVSGGLVERRPADHDRRTVVVSLTFDGRAVANAAERDRLSRLRCMLQRSLSAEQRAQLTPLAETMLSALTDDNSALWRICRLCAFEACPDCPVAAGAAA